MTTTASAGLIAALKASLADSDAGWTVRRVSEEKWLASVTGSTAAVTGTVAAVSGTITGGNGSVTGGGGSVTGGSGSTSSAAAVRTTVEMSAPSLRAGVGSRAALALTYVSVAVAGSFSEAFIRANGAEFRSTDSALDTTVQVLATAFLAAADTALTAALVAGPQDDDGTELPADMRVSLVASLGATAHGWYARSRVENRTDSGLQVVVSLASNGVKWSPTTGLKDIPGQLAYIADLTAGGTFIAARLMFNGAEWRSRDATLHAAVMALASAYVARQATAITAAFR